MYELCYTGYNLIYVCLRNFIGMSKITLRATYLCGHIGSTRLNHFPQCAGGIFPTYLIYLEHLICHISLRNGNNLQFNSTLCCGFEGGSYPLWIYKKWRPPLLNHTSRVLELYAKFNGGFFGGNFLYSFIEGIRHVLYRIKLFPHTSPLYPLPNFFSLSLLATTLVMGQAYQMYYIWPKWQKSNI